MYWLLNVGLLLLLSATTSWNLLLGLGWISANNPATESPMMNYLVAFPPLAIGGCGLVAFGCATSSFLGIKNGRALLVLSAACMLTISIVHLLLTWLHPEAPVVFPGISLLAIVLIAIAAYLSPRNLVAGLQRRQATPRDLVLVALKILLAVGLILFWFLGASELAMLADPATQVDESDLAVVPAVNRFLARLGSDDFSTNYGTIQFLFMNSLFAGVLTAAFLSASVATFLARLFFRKRLSSGTN